MTVCCVAFVARDEGSNRQWGLPKHSTRWLGQAVAHLLLDASVRPPAWKIEARQEQEWSE